MPQDNSPSKRSRLPFDFWVVGVLGNLAFIAAAEADYQVDVAWNSPVIKLIALVYFVFSFFRVWTASRAYGGHKAFVWLARMVMIYLGIVWLVLVIAT
jgi:hypothetical protein